jgi:hypothetical protein
MERHWVIFGIALAAALGSSGCQNRAKKPAPAPDAAVWAGKMQGLAADVRQLVPYIYSRKAFYDPANAPRIKAGLKGFTKQAHAITPEMGKAYFGKDPLAEYSLESLQADLTRAAEAYDMGQLEYARGVAKNATSHCFRCHSVTKAGGGAAAWDLNSLELSSLTPLERADLLVAARKYDDASKLLEGLLGNKDYAREAPFDFEQALRKYLSLMIRAENNPNRPLKELDRILEMKDLPYYLSEQARSWRNSLLSWSKKPAKKTKKSDALTEAREHINRAGEIKQFAKDHAGDIEYLRATALLHEHLRAAKDTKSIADAYFLLGRAYEVLDELGYWNLHEKYYESCIITMPRSDLAKKCYDRLEASVYFGFSGSSGVHIPAAEQARLKRLKGMTL